MRWNDSIEATTFSWASITPLGVPVVPDVKTSSKTSVGAGAGQASISDSQSVGMVSSGSAAMTSTVVVGNRSRPASRGSGASRPVPMMRWRAPEALTIPSTASDDIRKSSGTRINPARIAPK